MLIKEKIGNIVHFDLGGKQVDPVSIEWHEASKRILHKKSKAGREVIIKFLNEPQVLTEGDVLWQNEECVIIVEIEPAEAIVIRPLSMLEMASLCYEIGNKHLPLFYNNGEIIVPYESPLFKMLIAAGYEAKRETRKLSHQLKTTVSPHGHHQTKATLFSKILQLTTTPANV
jgi:urease accessory protein